MELVHSRIQWYSVESSYPSVACMAEEDAQFQPMATNHRDIHNGSGTPRSHVLSPLKGRLPSAETQRTFIKLVRHSNVNCNL